jgi:hypothetical protein
MNYPLSATPSSSTFSTTTATPTASPSQHTSLSPVASAGIGIAFAGILIVAITIFCLHRRHLHLQQAALGTHPPDDVGAAADRRTPGPPPSYPNVQEIDGKAIHNIAPWGRPPEPPTPTVIRDVADSPNASTLNKSSTTRTVYEMDGQRSWNFARSRRTSQYT